MKKTILFRVLLIATITYACSEENAPSIPETVTDIDGNVYHTVIIGEQVWLKENLRVSKYNNGDLIPNVEDVGDWSSQTEGAWSYYVNDSQYDDPYGKMYNSFAVTDPRKICPDGWHVPSDEEWTELEIYIVELGEEPGGALKEAGTDHWLSPNTGATNTTGFTALPGGYRGGNGEFPIQNLGSFGLWWSSTEFDEENLWIRTMGYDWPGLGRQEGFNTAGLSCRCLMD